MVTTFSDGSGAPLAVGVRAQGDAADASRRWRSVWRIHFYAGLFAMPFLLLMAVTGLVILYTQPIQDWTQGSFRTVADGGTWRPFEDQERAVEARYPGEPVLSMTVPRDDHHSTTFAVDDGSAAGAQVFVDPYSARVLGRTNPDGGVVGLANRLHGFFDNEAVQVPLPTVSALWDGGKVMRDYVVGDLVLEILGVWTIVLVLSGLFLWWPRRGRARAPGTSGRAILGVRRGVSGRARWRDLHGLGGVLLVGLVLLTVTSGLAWSTYWGPNVTALADAVSPNGWTDAPESDAGHLGHLDKIGNKISWNTGDVPIPATGAADPDAAAPTRVSLDQVARTAEAQDLAPGYTIALPIDGSDAAGAATFGSFTLTNSWPRKTGEARSVFVDQFSGEVLAHQDAYGYGRVSYAIDTLVSTHMGTQLGLVSRIMMTALCLLTMWSVLSAAVMFWKRRRPGTLGLPRRPVDVRLAKRVGLVALAVGIVFPEWGVTALAVLAFDRFVIRRVGRLRVAFGQR